jgi:lipid-binding SYLF domain-containing protein
MTVSIRKVCGALIALLALAVHGTALADAREEAKLLVAAEVLDELREQRDTLIPERLLQQAYGVAVIPDVTKVALFLGGRRGSGVLTVRDSRGRFSNPVFINVTGISGGLQFGAQETDLVLVFTTKRGIEGIADGKLTLGAGASVAAGPVGRHAEAAAGTNAEVFAYSRSSGLFLGVALDGTAISIDTKSNRSFYGSRDVVPSEIMSGAATTDSENARRFLAALAKSTGETAGASVTSPPAGGAGTTVTPVQGPAPATVPAAPSSEVRTFPMEDAAPGSEPPR